MGKAMLRKSSFNWHRKLAWLSLLALLLFMGSAVTHPLLSWTGPKAAAFRPPTAVIKPQEISAIAPILGRHKISSAEVVKLVPSAQGNLLQVTQNRSNPRRYFTLTNGEELEGYDQQHAIWLANYYVGSSVPIPVKNVEFKTEFDSAYPWVNRLLPVYRVQFADEDNTSVYVYTELNALAGMGNDYKTQMQAIFRNLHTWSWLNGFEYARIAIMALLLASVLLMILAGLGLLLLLRGRSNIPKKTKIHRVFAYIVALPLLGFSISGFYHLLHYGLVDTHRGMVASKPILLSTLNSDVSFAKLPQQALNHVSLVQHNDELLYRLSMPQVPPKQAVSMPKVGGEHAHHSMSIAERTQQFKGQRLEEGGQYYSAVSGQRSVINDKDVAISLASEHLGVSSEKASNSQIIKRFGMHYDFRNKRLPVWQIDFNTELGDKIFVDPATGVMVDRLVNQDRYEGYSFSFLHKWNFLTPFTGRFWRDVLIVITLALSLIVSLLGLMMKLRRF